MCFNALPLDSNVQLKLRTAELEGIFNQWFSIGDMILSDNIQDTWLNIWLPRGNLAIFGDIFLS